MSASVLIGSPAASRGALRSVPTYRIVQRRSISSAESVGEGSGVGSTDGLAAGSSAEHDPSRRPMTAADQADARCRGDGQKVVACGHDGVHDRCAPDHRRRVRAAGTRHLPIRALGTTRPAAPATRSRLPTTAPHGTGSAFAHASSSTSPREVRRRRPSARSSPIPSSWRRPPTIPCPTPTASGPPPAAWQPTGGLFTLSTISSVALEDVAAAAPGAPRWFQLYAPADRDACQALVERAAAADYSAVVVTVDLPMPGNRERDRRSGFEIDLGTHLPPEQPVDPETGIVILPTLDWDELAWLRSVCPIPLLVKGVLRADDAAARRRRRRRRGLGQQPWWAAARHVRWHPPMPFPRSPTRSGRGRC